MTPGDYEFDAYIEEKELSELRKPKQQKVVYVNNPEDAAKIEALEKENKELKEQLQTIKDQQFEESDMAMEMTNAISDLNNVIGKLKQDHKKEVQKFQQDNNELKAELDKAKAEIAENSKKFQTYEEYQEEYRKHIAMLQEKIALCYYDKQEEKSVFLSADKDKSFMSPVPVNFNNLLIQSSDAEKAVPESFDKQKDSIKTDFSETNNQHSSGSGSRTSKKTNDPFG